LEGSQQPVEDVVGGEHLNESGCVQHGGIQDPGRIDSASRDNPGYGEKKENRITQLPVFDISAELGQLQQMVGAVVHNQHQRPDPGKVRGPGEHHQRYRRVVMDEHLPKILSLDVEELGDGERPVEGELDHVVHPHVAVHLVIWIIVPTVSDVPEPGLVPETVEPVDQDARVEHPPPARFAKLFESVWQVCLSSLSQPSFNLNVCEPSSIHEVLNLVL